MKTGLLGLVMMMVLGACASLQSDQTLLHEAVLDPGAHVGISSVDGNIFVVADHTPVKPGLHRIALHSFYLSCGSCMHPIGSVYCRTQAGYDYDIDTHGCGIRYSDSTLAARVHYRAYQQALAQPQTDGMLSLMERDIAKYFPTDPEHLKPKIQQQLQANRLAALQAAKARRVARRRTIIAFQGQLKAGERTNCGMVVMVKPRIVLVQSSVGQIWVKRQTLTPPFYSNSCEVGG